MKMKKFFCAVTAAALAFQTAAAHVTPSVPVCAPAAVAYAETNQAGLLKYSESYDGTVSVSCPDENKEALTSVVIPSQYNGKPVTTIGWSAFRNCKNLTSIEIPSSVTTINPEAFYGCTSLASIDIPKSVTSIGYLVFAYCTSLTSIELPDGITAISSNIFFNCTNLRSIVIPNSVTNIYDCAFENCKSLTSIDIPENVTEIGEYAFSGCTSLASINIPKGTKIGDLAFTNTLWLENQRKSDPLVIVNNYLIDGTACTGNVVIPNGVTRISESAFGGSELVSVTIPNSVTKIAYHAFANCNNLTSVKVPESVEAISSAFDYCPGLTAIDVDKNNETYSSVDGVWFNKDQTFLIQYPAGKTNTTYTIPQGVTYIYGGAFRENKNLTMVKIPKGVTTISVGAFIYCSNLTSVVIPDTCKSVDMSAFYGCNIKDVYYSGTEEQWVECNLNWEGAFDNATIHYGSTGPDESNTPGESDTPAPSIPEMKDMRVTSGDEDVVLTINEDGSITVTDVEDGSHMFTFSADHCAPREIEVTVENGTVTGLEDGVELHLFGDINGDNVVNTQDVARANAHVKGTSTLTGYDLACINVNNDENINVQDVALMNAHAKNTKLLW